MRREVLPPTRNPWGMVGVALSSGAAVGLALFDLLIFLNDHTQILPILIVSVAYFIWIRYLITGVVRRGRPRL